MTDDTTAASPGSVRRRCRKGTKSTCPHANLVYCPLYVASHDPRLAVFGCDDGKMTEDSLCAASRGLDFNGMLAALEAGNPLFIQSLAMRERNAAAQAQRVRNLQRSGLKQCPP